MENLERVYAENIAKDYMPKEERKIRQLEKLDKKVKTPAFTVALSVGIIGTLVFGTGILWCQTPLCFQATACVGKIPLMSELLQVDRK